MFTEKAPGYLPGVAKFGRFKRFTQVWLIHEGCQLSWRTVPRVRPSQGQPPAAGLRRYQRLCQGPAWSVGLGYVCDYGPQQRGFQAWTRHKEGHRAMGVERLTD